MVLIHKSGSRYLPNNYQPSYKFDFYYCETFRVYCQGQYFGHLTDNNLLSDQQHDFLPHRSCNSQLLLALNDLTQSIDQGFPTDVIYFDS